jgi:hypothetical protein
MRRSTLWSSYELRNFPQVLIIFFRIKTLRATCRAFSLLYALSVTYIKPITRLNPAATSQNKTMAGHFENGSLLVQPFSDAQASILDLLFPGFTCMSAAIDLNAYVPLLCFFGLFVFVCGRVCKYLFRLLETYCCKNSLPPKCFITLSDGQHLAKAVTEMQMTSQDLEQLILKVIDAKSNPLNLSGSAKPDAHPEAARASKLEHKTVTEVYASNGSLKKKRLMIYLGGMRRRRNTRLKNLQGR